MPNDTRKLGFPQIDEECRKESLDAILSKWEFHKHPSGELFLAALRQSEPNAEELIKKRLSASEYEESRKVSDGMDRIVDRVAGTPLAQVTYYARKLGIPGIDAKATSELLEAVVGFLAAECGHSRYDAMHMPLPEMADLLQASYRKLYAKQPKQRSSKGKPGRKRRRIPTRVLTDDESKAHDLYRLSQNYSQVGRDMEVTRQCATKWVKNAERKIKAFSKSVDLSNAVPLQPNDLPSTSDDPADQ